MLRINVRSGHTMLCRWQGGQFVAGSPLPWHLLTQLGHNWNKFRCVTWSSAVCDITWDVTRRLLNLICVDLWEFESKKVRFVAERPLEADQRGNLSGKLLQNDDMSRSCGLSAKCYQDFASAFWPFSQVSKHNVLSQFFLWFFQRHGQNTIQIPE